MSDEKEGIPVIGLIPGCYAERAGVRVGDLLLSVNEQPVKDMDDYVAAAALRKHSRTVVVLRDGILLDIEMAIGQSSPEGDSN